MNARPSWRGAGTAVLRATIAEAFGRKVVLWGLVASAAFVVLYAIAYGLLFKEMTRYTLDTGVETFVAAGTLTVLGLYVASFLSCFLAMTVAASSVGAEIESGVTQAVAVRPLRRSHWYLQRWAGLAILSVVYVIVLASALIAISNLISGYRPANAVALIALMCVQALFLLTVGMLLSTRLSAMACGVVLFFYFGFSWLGGFVSFIGSMAERESMTSTGTFVSLIAPSDGIWKAASAFAIPKGINPGVFGGRAEMPFASFGQPSAAYVAWVLVFFVLAFAAGVLSYQRRDL